MVDQLRQPSDCSHACTCKCGQDTSSHCWKAQSQHDASPAQACIALHHLEYLSLKDQLQILMAFMVGPHPGQYQSIAVQRSAPWHALAWTMMHRGQDNKIDACKSLLCRLWQTWLHQNPGQLCEMPQGTSACGISTRAVRCQRLYAQGDHAFGHSPFLACLRLGAG